MRKTFRRPVAAAALGLGLLLVGPPASAAEDDYTTSNGEVSGEVLERPADDGVGGAGAARGGVDSNRLPVTGGDVVGLAILGVGAIGVGTLLVRRAKSPTTVTAEG